MIATAGAASRILGTGLDGKARLLIGADWPALENASRAYPRTGGHLMLRRFPAGAFSLRTVAIAGVTIACLQGTPAEREEA